MSTTEGSPTFVTATTPTTRLRTPGDYEHLGDYLKIAWQRRHFAFNLARAQVEGQYTDNRLGRAWLVLDPIIMVSIYAIVFGVGLRGGRNVPNFLLWLLTGQIMFRFMQRMVSAGSTALLRNQNLLSSYAFPRIVTLMAENLKAFVQFVPSLGLLFVTALAFQQWPNPRWLAMPVVLVLSVAMCFGMGGILARMSFRFPDVAQLVDVTFRFLFFATFIFFPAEQLLTQGGDAGKEVYELLPIVNPLYSFVCLLRWVILNNGGEQLDRVIVSAVVWSTVMVTVGTVVFYRGELSYSAARILRKKARR